ncbi:hypothetical protein [Paenibacillus naphthalenovorans]|uniref:hypothetical protein n=1 Tax=Paenibacillus naphthalenovorans TaxID=162209 RepID=UPI003D2B8FC9
MNRPVYVIAGETEGFSYDDARIVRCDNELDAEAAVNALRHEGYRIFIVLEQVARIDDFIAGE